METIRRKTPLEYHKMRRETFLAFMEQLESRGVIRKKSKHVLSKNGIAKVKAREQKLLFH